MKEILKKSKDYYLTLLEYRNTPMSCCQITPAQLLMTRRLTTLLMQTENILTPKRPDLNKFRKKEEQYKRRQKNDYDRRYRATPLPELQRNDNVWISIDQQSKPGQVIDQADTRQSYLVETSDNGR